VGQNLAFGEFAYGFLELKLIVVELEVHRSPVAALS
jgi:hypothetical protein